jgi:hypothetical protein
MAVVLTVSVPVNRPSSRYECDVENVWHNFGHPIGLVDNRGGGNPASQQRRYSHFQREVLFQCPSFLSYTPKLTTARPSHQSRAGHMSVLDVGARCSSCDLVDFLPISCNHCSLIYCKNHIATHGCVEISIRESYPEAGPSSFARKTRCDVKGCTNPTIESIGGFQADSTEEETLVKRVRCLTCGGAFCTA